MKLFEFAYCSYYGSKIKDLSLLCTEKWSFGNNVDNFILKNYISHTFIKFYEENKIIESNKYALFNTGLFTNDYYEPIYAYFTVNSCAGKQKWELESFRTKYQLSLLGISKFPERANYFSNPSDLVFNTNLNIIPQYKHIFEDEENLIRIPKVIRDNSNKVLLFDGALKRAKMKIDANYKVAVPQYYKGQIQLLIPICLIDKTKPDLALVVSKDSSEQQYIGHTCLTLNMAYNNARLIAKPDAVWLTP